MTGFDSAFSYTYSIQCAFESQQIDFCNFAMRREIDLRHCDTTPSDFAALGYVISTTSTVVSKLKWNADTSEDKVSAFFSTVTECAITKIKVLNYFCRTGEPSYKAMNYSLSKLSSLEKLEFDHFVLNKSSVLTLTRNIQVPNLRCLEINFSDITCSNPEEVLELLKFGSSSNVKVYYSCRDKEDYGTSRKLLNYVFDSSAHQASDISWLYLYNSNEISSVPPERFSHCTDVVLVNCGIDDNRAEILASNIRVSVLEKLVLDFNRISDSGAKALAEHLIGSCSLQVFSVQCNSITDSGAAALASSIAGIRSLRKLDLQGNGIGDEGVVAIAKAATEATPGLDLYIYNVEVTQEGISRVLEHRATTHIKTMVFGSSWDSICDEGIEALRSVLKSGDLQVLRISDTGINSLTSNMENIRTALAEESVGKNLRSLEIGGGGVTEDNVPALCDILERTKNLNYLNISYLTCDDPIKLNKLHDKLNLHEQLLSVSLYSSLRLLPYFMDAKVLTNVHALSIVNSMYLSIKDVRLLCGVLVHLKNLSSLKLSKCGIDATGAVALAEALKDHTGLTELAIDYNDISLINMSAFASVIRANNIRHLTLSSFGTDGPCEDLALAIVDHGNELQSLRIGGTRKCVRIIDGLHKMRHLVELYIDWFDIGSQIVSLAEGLKYCTQLVKFGITRCSIKSQGIASLAEGLQNCINLREINLSSNLITPDGVPAIVLVMENCHYLQKLDLRDNFIGIDGAALLVEGWKHKTVFILKFGDSLEGGLHPRWNHLLQLYHLNDSVILDLEYHRQKSYLPKLIHSSNCEANN